MKGLYVHIPFCAKKCEYCDFISFPCMEKRFSEYIDAVEQEMKGYNGEKIDTVFIGGGTPSLLPPELIKRLCTAIFKNFQICKNTEFSMEINPGTISDEKISAMRKGGINRVSVGIQSFNDSELKAVGRIHDAKTAYDTVVKLERSGFENISVDLMQGLPYQTEESFKNTLKKAMELSIKHISVYSLIIEEGTPIKKKYDEGIYKELDEDTDRELYKFTEEYLRERGFKRYEISNYAVDGYESRHNIKYWQFDDYIGIGLGAHSCVDGVRFSNTSSIDKYINGEFGTGEREVLSMNDRMSEFMMLGLRMMCGVSEEEFYKRFGIEINEMYGKILDKYIRSGFIEKEKGRYYFTENGINVSNAILCEFI